MRRLMIRKICVVSALLFAVAGIAFAPQAAAQGETQCRIVFVDDDNVEIPPTSTVTVETDTVNSADATAVHSCADAEPYPGPFTNMPSTPSSPYSAPVGLSPPAPAVPVEATAPSSGAGLAHSGSETFVLAYLGTGLLAFGAVALGVRRGSALE